LKEHRTRLPLNFFLEAFDDFNAFGVMIKSSHFVGSVKERRQGDSQ
jgi:hypothetical protein